jgi:hypothetical protein
MTIVNQHQLEVTQRKLKELEQFIAERQNDPVENKLTRELSLRSLKQVLNRLKEEITRYQATKTSE